MASDLLIQRHRTPPQAQVQHAPQAPGLDRLALCAGTAILSSLLTFGACTWRSRCRSGLAQASVGKLGKARSTPEAVIPTISRAEDSQRLAKLQREVTELEALLHSSRAEKAHSDAEIDKLSQQQLAMSDRERDLRHRVSEAISDCDRLTKRKTCLEHERDKACSEARSATAKADRALAELAEAAGHTLELERKLAAQTEARRAADRRVKDAEVKLSGVVSARHRLERESKDRNQDLASQLKSATERAAKAEGESQQYKDRVSSVQRKVQATGGTLQRISSDLDSTRHQNAELEARALKHKQRADAAAGELLATQKQLLQCQADREELQQVYSRFNPRYQQVVTERNDLQSELHQLNRKLEQCQLSLACR